MILKSTAREIAVNAVRLWAWWKDGVEYVGSCGKTFAEAQKEIMSGKLDAELGIDDSYPDRWTEVNDE
jgi:hypothetical protein